GRRCVRALPPLFCRRLEPSERKVLRRHLAGGREPLALRARIVLLSAAQVPVSEIIRRLDLSRPPVRVWLTRFEQAGVAGLRTRRRSGRPAKVSPAMLRLIATVI